MAKFGPFKNGFIEINGVNYSDHCSEFSVNESAAELENHAHGDEVAQKNSGLFDWEIPATFFQDFAAGSIDANLRTLFINRTAFVVQCRPDGGAVSATNPMYSGYGQLFSYSPMAGKHGDNMMTQCSIKPASGAVLARKTS